MRKAFCVLTLYLAMVTIIYPYTLQEKKQEPIVVETISQNIIVEEISRGQIIEKQILPDEDIDLIALVTMAEAENQCDEGKRLVIDTILNRVDSSYFPNTVHEVIYQKSQFSSMWNGRVDRCVVKEDIRKLVLEELESRMNYDVMFFNAGDYSKYGVPKFKVGDHYFSSY